MVSTTLQTIAAAPGQTTSGINNLHSTTTINNSSVSPERRYHNTNSTTGEATNRSIYYQASRSSSSSGTTTSASTHNNTSNSTTSPQNNKANLRSYYYNNSNRLNVNNDNGQQHHSKLNGNESDNTAEYQQQNHNNLTFYQREQQKYLVNGKVVNGETTKAETTTSGTPSTGSTHTLDLSQALISSSPPISDQISLLFPKCRPKSSVSQHQSQQHQSNSPGAQLEATTTTVDANSNCNKEDQLNNSTSAAAGLKVKHHSNKGHSNKTETNDNKERSSNNSHYYRSVNIITQSPPPHSASSLSSESLSSVTPRISTNPFLCNQLLTTEEAEEPPPKHSELIREEENKLHRDNSHNEDDELPVPITAPFYYHTNTTTTSPKAPREKHQRQHNTDTADIREMPRKRSQYERYHHMNGQNYPSEKAYNHGMAPATEANSNSQQNGHPNQNPFVKDNYWENSRQTTNSNNTPTSTVLNSPEYGGHGGNNLPEMEHSRSQHRRSMYQQEQTAGGQQTPQQQHQTQNTPSSYMNTRQHIRLGRSPNSESATYSETTQKRNSYNSAQAQNAGPHQNSNQKSYANSETGGLKTLAQHYLYGSKTSLQEHGGTSHTEWPEKRESHEQRSAVSMREREREQRGKTERYINAALVRESVGEPNTPATLELRDRRERERDRQSYPPPSQAQMQKYQQKASHQYHHQQRSSQQQQHHTQQQQHNQSHRQLAEDRLSSNNEVIFDDITESWQNLRVTTDSSSQINQNRNSLLAGEVKAHHHDVSSNNQMSATTGSGGVGVGSSSNHLLSSIPKKSHLLMSSTTTTTTSTTNDGKDDKHQSHSQTSQPPHHVSASVVVNSSDIELSSSSSFKDHNKKYSEKNHGISVESRHGIIEYEGSPRRIGQMGNNSNNDEDHHHHQQHHRTNSNKIQGNATNKTNHHRDAISSSNNTTTSTTVVSGGGGGGVGAAANISNNSPKQHYTARPGFPQRIISPQRETTPPIMLLNYNGKSQQQQQQQQHHQQQLSSQQQSPTRDNNAEDTSNDVSEIGTISDLTTPEAIIHPAGTAGIVTGTGSGSRATCDSRATTSPSPPLLPSSANLDMETTAGTSISASATTTAAPTATTSMTVSSKCSTPTTPPNTSATTMTSLNNLAASTSSPTTGVNVSTAAAATVSPPSATTITTPSSSILLPSNIVSSNPLTIPTKSSTFDYLYEFSETRKVLEEFFKCPSSDDKPIIENSSDVDSIDIQYEFHTNLNRGDIEEDEGDGDIEGDDDDDEIQLDGDNDEDIDNDVDDDDEDVETPQHHQPPTHLGQHQMHQQQQQLSMQTQNNHHGLNHHSNFRNHLQSPTQFTYRPYNEDEDDDMDLDNEARHNEMQHHYEQHQHQQQQQHHQEQQENHHNFSLLNNRHATSSNTRQHNSRRHFTGSPLMRDFDFFLDSASRSSCEQIDQQIDGINHNQMNAANRQNYRYSPETTDYDSNCGDLDSLSGEMNGGVSTSCSNYAKYYASSMPVLEDGLSSGHTSDTENNNQNSLLNQQNSGIHHTPLGGGISMLMDMKRVSTNNSINSMNNTTISTTDGVGGGSISGGGSVVNDKRNTTMSPNLLHDSYLRKNESPINGLMVDEGMREPITTTTVRTKNEIRDAREIIGQSPNAISNNKVFKNIDPDLDSLYSISVFHRNDMVQMTPPPPAPAPHRKPNVLSAEPDILQPTPYRDGRSGSNNLGSPTKANNTTTTQLNNGSSSNGSGVALQSNTSPTQQAQSIKRAAQQQQQQPPPLPERNAPARSPSPVMNSPVWLTRHLEVNSQKGLLESPSANHSKNLSADEDDVDTDLETDRLLGHQRLDDQGYYDENKTWDRKPARSLLSKISPKQVPSTKTRNGYNALLSSTPEIPPPVPPKNSSNKLLDIGGSMSSPEHSDKSPIKSIDIQDCGLTLGSPGGSEGSGCMKKDLDNGIGGGGPASGNSSTASGNIVNSGTGGNAGGGGGTGSSVGSTGSTTGEKKVKKSKNKEVLIEGVLFRAKYLGSTQLVCEGQPTKSTRMMQAEEAVSRIKAPDGDVQPSTEVDLFISTEKIMVLNTDLKEIMMDHALRTISYIADIGDLVVLMARRRFVPQDIDDAPKPNRTPKMICHVFESDEAQFIAQSIGQAFQVAYMEFLKANGIEDHRFVKEMDYQEVLNSQEIFGDELEIFAKKELQKEVVVPKAKGEILGVVIVESGWGSMLPTVVIANLMSSGAAARCGQLNIGDQLIAINGLSLVGLPLSTCQTYIKNTKNQTVVKFTVVPCPPVVEVKIKRPETKYQLGFSVQNGVICSLLRGGIAERGGVRVGHRIIEINNQSVVAVPHEKIVNLLATSVGEILMKTMPTSMFRLLTGQENPIYI
ncbi:X11Lbeta isoform X2 [Musca autumnalis]|uniref:X11Lbeta isoform X2 n=1 Tax=Musca autumnalis TaxID=221902 RepID=UPI003CED645D